MQRCWDVIDAQAEIALLSEGFTDIDFSTLLTIMRRETLNCGEYRLSEAFMLHITQSEASMLTIDQSQAAMLSINQSQAAMLTNDQSQARSRCSGRRGSGPRRSVAGGRRSQHPRT